MEVTTRAVPDESLAPMNDQSSAQVLAAPNESMQPPLTHFNPGPPFFPQNNFDPAQPMDWQLALAHDQLYTMQGMLYNSFRLKLALNRISQGTAATKITAMRPIKMKPSVPIGLPKLILHRLPALETQDASMTPPRAL